MIYDFLSQVNKNGQKYYNEIYRQRAFDLTFMFFQALLSSKSQKLEDKMSEQTEKLVKIIMPDLLNYLEMVESREIIYFLAIQLERKFNHILVR